MKEKIEKLKWHNEGTTEFIYEIIDKINQIIDKLSQLEEGKE